MLANISKISLRFHLFALIAQVLEPNFHLQKSHPCQNELMRKLKEPHEIGLKKRINFIIEKFNYANRPFIYDFICLSFFFFSHFNSSTLYHVDHNTTTTIQQQSELKRIPNKNNNKQRTNQPTNQPTKNK